MAKETGKKNSNELKDDLLFAKKLFADGRLGA